MGAAVALNVADVFDRTRIVILMLANEPSLDSVLGRGTEDFKRRVGNHIIVSMGSNSPDYSRELCLEIISAGGQYVEAPVSGSRRPAEDGQLISMLGGDVSTIAEIRPLLLPMCREAIYCGPVGSALLMKLAVNLYLNTMLVGLAEAIHFGGAQGLDLDVLKAVIDAGPMACDVTRVKIRKLISRDFAAQAAISDVYKNMQLISSAARSIGLSTPLLDVCSDLYREGVELGNGSLDIVSVIDSIERRTGKI